MISVIIPCFNSEEFVARAIDSVLRQTFTDYEIILVNNNSSDNTMNILNEYSKKYPHFITVLEERKKGAPAARNRGLLKAKGDWIQFLDADDELLPTKLESQKAIADHSEADIIVSNCYISKVLNGKTERKIRDIETENIWKGLITSKLGITSANLWRREAVIKAGAWNETRSSSQEYDLLFRLLKNNNKVTFNALPLTIIHVRENSIHKSVDSNRTIEILNNNVQLRLAIKEYLKTMGILTKELSSTIDIYIYTYLFNTTGVFPLLPKQGIIADFVHKTLKETKLELPAGFILNFHYKRLRYKIKNKL